MKRNMRNIFKVLILSVVLVFPTTLVLSIDSQQKDTSSMLIFFQPRDLDIPKLFLIPHNTIFQDINIKQHTYQSISSPKPQMTFYTTNNSNPHPIISNTNSLVYDAPFDYNHYKVGNFELIQLLIPSTYYSNNKKYTTTSIILEIELKEALTLPVSKNDLSLYTPLIENSALLDDFNSNSFQTTVPQATYEYIIITTPTLYDSFNNNFKSWKISQDSKISNIRIINISEIVNNPTYYVNGSYGDATNTANGNPWIANGEEIYNNYSLFNDTQAKIRNYLRYCYTTLNTRYILLGGNYQLVPTRYTATHASGDNCLTYDSDMNHSCDMYYSNLHKCQNNNTDQYWMLNPCCDMSFDDIDWGIDLYVGRVPAANPQQLNYWINKTKAYVDNPKSSNYYNSNIVAARADDNSITNDTWYNRGGEFSASLNDEFPSNFSFVDNQNISSTNWSLINDFCNGDIPNWDGISIILQAGHATINGGLFWDEYQPSTLNNPNNPNFVYCEGCFIGEFGTSTVCGTQTWMNDQNCTFASIANSAFGWFGASTHFVEDMMKQMFNSTANYNNLTFCQAHAAARTMQGSTYVDGVWAMIFKETNFFGDPALDWQWNQSGWTPAGQSTSEFISINDGLNGTTIHTSTPTLNWTKTSNTSQYQLQIATDSTFASLVLNLSNITIFNFPAHLTLNDTSVSFTLPSIYALPTFNTKYYCRVRTFQR